MTINSFGKLNLTLPDPSLESTVVQTEMSRTCFKGEEDSKKRGSKTCKIKIAQI